jgi:hypothetical protein
MNVNAVQYVSAMQEGWSKPQLFRCDDGNEYVVKLMNNPQGLRVLPNEMISYRLGRLLHLPVGECTVVHISEELINISPSLRDMQVKAGPHLGSLYYKKAKVLQEANDMKGCHNLNMAAGMIAFDHWIQNWDRCWHNASNVLVLKEHSKFIMIDHANAFTGQWTIDSLKQNRSNSDIYWGKIYKLFVPYIHSDHPFKKIVWKIDSLSKADLWTAMDGLPPEWQVSYKELYKLVKYLDYRKSATAEVLYKLKKYFPRWH